MKNIEHYDSIRIQAEGILRDVSELKAKEEKLEEDKRAEYARIRVAILNEVINKVDELERSGECPEGCNCTSQQKECPYSEATKAVKSMLKEMAKG